MTDTLTGMADAGADIAKLAVMPRNRRRRRPPAGGHGLRHAAARPGHAAYHYEHGPVGAVTRFCGGAFGSCATFGVTSGTAASAPGQPPADSAEGEKLITRRGWTCPRPAAFPQAPVRRTPPGRACPAPTALLQ